MNTRQANSLELFRELWKEGNKLLPQLSSFEQVIRSEAIGKAFGWAEKCKIFFRRMFYSQEFYDEFVKIIPQRDEFGDLFSETTARQMLSHIEAIGKMIKFEYIKDQYVGINNERSKNVFVAMSFDSEFENLFYRGIKPGIEFLGYSAIRVDKVQHNERIDAKIFELIKQSKFVVADFSGQRSGVYYETGFAKGMGLPVIHLCIKKEEPKLHFDIKTVNTILYNSIDELRENLKDRIEKTIGTYKSYRDLPDSTSPDIPF